MLSYQLNIIKNIKNFHSDSDLLSGAYFALRIDTLGRVVEMDFHLVHEFKYVIHLLIYLEYPLF